MHDNTTATVLLGCQIIAAKICGFFAMKIFILFYYIFLILYHFNLFRSIQNIQLIFSNFL